MLGTIWVILAVVMQYKSENLISALKSDKTLYEKAGSPSYEYFMGAYLCFMDKSFTFFVIKNKTLPAHVLSGFSDYSNFRTMTIVLESLHFSVIIMCVILIWT
jgi:hypothetical protein